MKESRIHILSNEEAENLATLTRTGNYGGSATFLKIPYPVIRAEADGVKEILSILAEMYNLDEDKKEIEIYSRALWTQTMDTGGYAAFYIDCPMLRDIRLVINTTVPNLMVRPWNESIEDMITGSIMYQRGKKARKVAEKLAEYLEFVWNQTYPREAWNAPLPQNKKQTK